MHFLEICDHALIYFLEGLDLPELCAMAMTCQRLNLLARTIANKRYKYLSYVNLMYDYSNFIEYPVSFEAIMEFIGPSVLQILLDGIYTQCIRQCIQID